MQNIKTARMVFVLNLLMVAGCSKTATEIDSHHSYPVKDFGVQPKAWMSFRVPRYLSTDLKPDVKFNINHNQGTMIAKDVYPWLAQTAIVETYPGQKPVAGKWIYSEVYSESHFQPDSRLAPGDYLLRFPKANDEYVFQPYPFNLLRVGSILRITSIDLLRDRAKGTTDLMQVTINYSETPPAGEQVTVTAQQQEKDASWQPLSAVMESQYSMKLSQAVDPQKPLRLSISSPSLDGKWTGKAGSGSLDVEFIPGEHQIEPGQVQYYVVPDLSINLPEGTPK